VRLSTQKGAVLKISRLSSLHPFDMYSQFFAQVVHPETNQTELRNEKLENAGHHAMVIPVGIYQFQHD
jgi:hypothetical protein